jgi:hypothetical protein
MRHTSLYDSLIGVSGQGRASPEQLTEWSEVIEKKANAGSSGPRISFKGSTNETGRFGIQVDAPGPDEIVHLLEAIQESLTLMPTIPREFFGALMVSIAEEAEKNEGSAQGSG